MNYELEFIRDAWKEWHKLDSSLKEQFKKKLQERLKNPRIESNRLVSVNCRIATKSSLAIRDIVWSIEWKIVDWLYW